MGRTVDREEWEWESRNGEWERRKGREGEEWMGARKE